MTEHAGHEKQKPFRVEVTVDAPRDAVWRALRDPAEIRRWFGWDYESLDEEIRMIFVDDTTPVPPERIEFGGPAPYTIELVPDGARTVVRIVCAGSLADTEWEDVYDPTEEGWRAFFHQLRHYLERHPGDERRTVFLAGDAPPAEVVRAVDALAPGRPWHASRYLRATAVDTLGGGLIVVAAPSPIDSAEPARANVTVTTHGLDDAAFAEERRRWEEWWAGVAGKTKVLVGG